MFDFLGKMLAKPFFSASKWMGWLLVGFIGLFLLLQANVFAQLGETVPADNQKNPVGKPPIATDQGVGHFSGQTDASGRVPANVLPVEARKRVGDGPTIAQISSSYYGNLSRPLVPDTSLFLPLWVQGVISLGLVLAMLFISLFLPTARQLVVILTFITVSRHLLWRLVETLSFDTMVTTIIGYVIIAAEIMAYFSLISGYFQMYGQKKRDAIPLQGDAAAWPSVDIYLCTYNEPVSVVYRSLVGCVNVEYPKKEVYLLDDGSRPEMAELAAKVGAKYITREDNRHAKSGNLNSAMPQTRGDLILVFDADHVPCKTFLYETVGFFMRDPKLGYLQTPQHFFTQDPFQRNLIAPQIVNNEQDLFFHVIQPGNDYWDAAFFAGTGAIFRRDALQGIGGFAVETITEDVHTGMRLQKAGWHSAFYEKDLSAGMAQDSFTDFVKQRLRWARGMSQIFLLENPLLTFKLSLPQKICYAAGMYYFFQGLPRIIFLLAPLAFLIFGYMTVNAGIYEILIYYLPSFVCIFLGYSILTHRLRHSFWSEVYETALCVYLLIATTLTFLSPRKASFRVTPKGTVSDRIIFNWQIVFPQVIIAGLTVIGIGMAVVRAVYTPEYQGGVWTNLFWSLYNLTLLVCAIYVAQERPQYRLAPRVNKEIRAEIRLLDGTIAIGRTINMSESGMAVQFEEPIPVAGTLALKLVDSYLNDSTVLSVQAVRSNVNFRNQHTVGFRVVNRTEEQHQKLVLHMFANPEVWRYDHKPTSLWGSLFKLLETPFRISNVVERAFKRRTPRFQATLPCLILTNTIQLQGHTEDVSETGMGIVVSRNSALRLGDIIGIRIQWPNGEVTDIKGKISRLAPMASGQCRLGVNYIDMDRDRRMAFVRLLYQPREGLVRTAPAIEKILSVQLITEQGQTISGSTQEISEMGLSLIANSRSGLPNVGEQATANIRWEDGSTATYRTSVIHVQDDGRTTYPLIILYFQGLDLKNLTELGEKLHR